MQRVIRTVGVLVALLVNTVDADDTTVTDEERKADLNLKKQRVISVRPTDFTAKNLTVYILERMTGSSE